MRYFNELSSPIHGHKAKVRRIGWIGDSICEALYLGAESDRFGFPFVVSSALGAICTNKAVSGRTLSSFLNYLTGAVGSTVAEFNGQWLNDGGNWYWNRNGSWIAVPDEGSSVNRVGTHQANLTDLYSYGYVIIAQSGVNDDAANNYTGATDFDANGSYHYKLLLDEILKRLHENNVTVMMVTGTTASDPDFHGKTELYSQELVGRYSADARESCFENGIYCCDVGVRLNIELALGRLDILSRIATSKPDNMTTPEWDAYLASKGDPAKTNIYRVFDSSEDELHRYDINRDKFWYNLHPNAFGHYVIANELLRFINEKGFNERIIM